MVQWVYEQAKKANRIDRVIVATDHLDIKRCVESFSGEVRMTDPSLPSGTDRVYAAIENEDADIIINLQGDEPFISPQLLDDLVSTFENESIKISTPICKIEDKKELFNPNVVGVVRDMNGFALYFSRSTIPFIREYNEDEWLAKHTFFKHIGIYAYRRTALETFIKLPVSAREKTESLEQLRALDAGMRIDAALVDTFPLGVDTPADLERVRAMLKAPEKSGAQ